MTTVLAERLATPGSNTTTERTTFQEFGKICKHANSCPYLWITKSWKNMQTLATSSDHKNLGKYANSCPNLRITGIRKNMQTLIQISGSKEFEIFLLRANEIKHTQEVFLTSEDHNFRGQQAKLHKLRSPKIKFQKISTLGECHTNLFSIDTIF